MRNSNFEGSLTKGDVLIEMVLNTDGTYQFVEMQLRGDGWIESYREAGTYQVVGDRIRMDDAEGNHYDYRYTVEEYQLWVDFTAEYGGEVGFVAE